MKYYHTALKGKFKTFYPEVENLIDSYTDQWGNTIFTQDIMLEPLSKEFQKCNAIYCEPPFPHGFKIFNKRANKNYPSGYEMFCQRVQKIVLQELTNKRPLFMITNKKLLSFLPTPHDSKPVLLNDNPETVSVWNFEINFDFETNYELVGNLVHFGCIGDFCCGYGSPLIHFLKSGGQQIVGSDFDRKCITVFKERLENGEYQK